MAKSNVKYELLAAKPPDFSPQYVPKLKNDVKKPSSFWFEILLTSQPILLFFILSVGHSVYQQSSLDTWRFPLSLVLFNSLVKFLISALMRCLLKCNNGQRRVGLSTRDTILSVLPPGIAVGVYWGFSTQSFELLDISLYSTIQAVTIIFILELAFRFHLEKKSWSLTITVLLISGGLGMCVYKPTNVNVSGMFLALVASFSRAFLYTTTQDVMQKSKLRLQNPIDMMYCIQPWVLLSTIPVALVFEGTQVYTSISNTDWADTHAILVTTSKILVGAGIAVCLELTEFLIISHMSSLTLATANTFKILCTYVQFYQSNIYLMSNVNFVGVLACFAGIIVYVILKLGLSETDEGNKELEENSESDLNEDLMIPDKTKITTISSICDQKYVPNA